MVVSVSTSRAPCESQEPLVFKCEARQLRQRLLFAAVHPNNITWANV